MAMVLILFCGRAYSFPLFKTCYTVAEDTIDLSLGEEFYAGRRLHRVDTAAFSLGLTDSTTAGVNWRYLNYDLSGDESESGDLIVNLWHYTGRYLNEKLDTGLDFSVRIPTGPDPAAEEKWRNLSAGISEIRINSVFSFRATAYELLNFNLAYTFREDRGEDFYGGFKKNIRKSSTYRALFGLNPFYNGAFLDHRRLSNDYVTTAFSVIESRLYPVVLNTGIYHTFTDFQGDNSDSAAFLEGEGGSFTLVSAVLKYFFSESAFCSIQGTFNPFYTEGETQWMTGAGINLFF